MAELHVRATTEEAAQAKAQFVADLAKDCLAAQGQFTIALSGGSTPRRLYQVLAAPPYVSQMEWERSSHFVVEALCYSRPGPVAS